MSLQNLAGDADIDHVARFESGAWHPVGNGGLNNVVQDILIDGSDIYIAGWFTDAGGDANADKVARLGSGGDWEALSANPAINGNVYTMVQWTDDIIIGGLFTDAGGDADAD